MDVFEKLISIARSRTSHIVLSEGNDARVARAAVRAASDGIAQISVVADREKFLALTKHLSGHDMVEVHEPTDSQWC